MPRGCDTTCDKDDRHSHGSCHFDPQRQCLDPVRKRLSAPRSRDRWRCPPFRRRRKVDALNTVGRDVFGPASPVPIAEMMWTHRIRIPAGLGEVTVVHEQDVKSLVPAMDTKIGHSGASADAPTGALVGPSIRPIVPLLSINVLQVMLTRNDASTGQLPTASRSNIEMGSRACRSGLPPRGSKSERRTAKRSRRGSWPLPGRSPVSTGR
jgi:hypothetical protein